MIKYTSVFNIKDCPSLGYELLNFHAIVLTGWSVYMTPKARNLYHVLSQFLRRKYGCVFSGR